MSHQVNGSVSPYLIVSDARATIDFLVGALDAEERRVFPDADGRLIHAEVELYGTVIMIADEAPPQWPAKPSYVHIYVEDVDVTYRRALQAGAQSVQEPSAADDGEKRGGVRDPGGTTWWIATPLKSQ